MDIIGLVNNVPIRFPEERWNHIVENHDYLTGYYEEILRTVESPDFVLRGYKGALIAVKGIGRKKYLSVVYKELSQNDGFILSAYITPKINRGSIIWRNKP